MNAETRPASGRYGREAAGTTRSARKKSRREKLIAKKSRREKVSQIAKKNCGNPQFSIWPEFFKISGTQQHEARLLLRFNECPNFQAQPSAAGNRAQCGTVFAIRAPLLRHPQLQTRFAVGP